MRLNYTTPPYPSRSGYITLQTSLRTYRRFIQITNTHFIYGHRPDKILFTTDLSRCELTITGTHLKLRLPGRKLVFSLSRPEMHVWYPLLSVGTANIERFYTIGARVYTMLRYPVFSGADRGDGSSVRIWRVMNVGWDTPGLRIRCHRVVGVRDLFVGCHDVHVVFEEFGGIRIRDVPKHDVNRFIVKDILGVLSVLHGRGLIHTNLEEATFIRDGSAAVILFGYVEKGHPGPDLNDIARVMEMICDPCEAVNRVVAMLKGGTPALEVLQDEWFAGGEEPETREEALKRNYSHEVESPRSVLPGIDHIDR